MRPSPAEIARTLAAGRLPGVLRTAAGGPVSVRHAAARDGGILFLVEDGGTAAGLLAASPGDDVAALVRVDDIPPVAGAPGHGRLWTTGWARPLEPAEAAAAALEFADVHPTGDLLTLGEGRRLHRMDVVEVRLQGRGGWTDVDAVAFGAAEPDPIAAEEAALLADLDDHHGEQVARFAARRLEACGRRDLLDGPPPRIVRLDRYGMSVAAGGALVRMPFPVPVAHPAELVARLRPLLGLRCRCDGSCDR